MSIYKVACSHAQDLLVCTLLRSPIFVGYIVLVLPVHTLIAMPYPRILRDTSKTPYEQPTTPGEVECNMSTPPYLILRHSALSLSTVLVWRCRITFANSCDHDYPVAAPRKTSVTTNLYYSTDIMSPESLLILRAACMHVNNSCHDCHRVRTA